MIHCMLNMTNLFFDSSTQRALSVLIRFLCYSTFDEYFSSGIFNPEKEQ